MSCDDVRQLLSPLLDLQLRGEERDQALQHLASCRECSARAEELDEVRSVVRRMRATPVPVRLVTQLRIDASKERLRQASRRSLSARIGAWASVARLSLDNLMRPMALPFAGGVFTAFLMFTTLVPTLAFPRNTGIDVPIALFTDPTLEELGQSRPANDETVLQLTVDDRGRVSEFSVPQGKLTREMMNDLLFYRFTPATAFGQPTWGKVTVTFRRSAGSHIVVRG